MPFSPFPTKAPPDKNAPGQVEAADIRRALEEEPTIRMRTTGPRDMMTIRAWLTRDERLRTTFHLPVPGIDP